MIKRGKLKTYIIYYSGRSSGRVKAFSASGARKQAWAMLGGFVYGWKKSDFLRNATITRI